MALYTLKYAPSATLEGSNTKSTTVTADAITFNAGFIVFTLGTVTTKIIRMDLIDEAVLGT